MATRFRKPRPSCDVCGEAITGEPAGHGVMLKVRGDAVVQEPLPLCGECALAIGMSAMFRFAEEEEEG